MQGGVAYESIVSCSVDGVTIVMRIGHGRGASHSVAYEPLSPCLQDQMFKAAIGATVSVDGKAADGGAAIATLLYYGVYEADVLTVASSATMFVCMGSEVFEKFACN